MDTLVRFEDRLEGLPPLTVRAGREVFLPAKEAVEREEGDRELLRHPFQVGLPSPTAAHFLEGQELACIRIHRDSLAFDDRLSALDCRAQPFHDFRELDRDVL